MLLGGEAVFCSKLERLFGPRIFFSDVIEILLGVDIIAQEMLSPPCINPRMSSKYLVGGTH